MASPLYTYLSFILFFSLGVCSSHRLKPVMQMEEPDPDIDAEAYTAGVGATWQWDGPGDPDAEANGTISFNSGSGAGNSGNSPSGFVTGGATIPVIPIPIPEFTIPAIPIPVFGAGGNNGGMGRNGGNVGNGEGLGNNGGSVGAGIGMGSGCDSLNGCTGNRLNGSAGDDGSSGSDDEGDGNDDGDGTGSSCDTSSNGDCDESGSSPGSTGSPFAGGEPLYCIPLRCQQDGGKQDPCPAYGVYFDNAGYRPVFTYWPNEGSGMGQNANHKHGVSDHQQGDTAGAMAPGSG